MSAVASGCPRFLVRSSLGGGLALWRRGLAINSPDKEVTGARLARDRQVLTVHWRDGQESQFAASWLKENCPSPAVTDPDSHGRLLLMGDLDPGQEISRVSHSSSRVTLDWGQGDSSTFSSHWLSQRAWRGAQEGAINRVLWEGAPTIPVHSYPRVMQQDSALLEWLTDLTRHGLTVLEDTPCDTNSTKELVLRLGTPKNTHFGPFWNVVAKSEPMNLAYTSATLGLHLDLPFYENTPGVQVLQCVKQHTGQGGANVFADAFSVAQRMRKEHPAEFHLLSTQQVHFWDAGSLDDDSLAGGVSASARQFHKRHSRPTFLLGEQGELTQVSFNNQVRSSQPPGDARLTQQLLRALKLFNSLCYSEEHLVTYKLREGDTAVFDNLRVMHGREGFTVRTGEDSARHLFGCYIDWDEIRDRVAVLTDQPRI